MGSARSWPTRVAIVLSASLRVHSHRVRSRTLPSAVRQRTKAHPQPRCTASSAVDGSPHLPTLPLDRQPAHPRSPDTAGSRGVVDPRWRRMGRTPPHHRFQLPTAAVGPSIAPHSSSHHLRRRACGAPRRRVVMSLALPTRAHARIRRAGRERGLWRAVGETRFLQI